MVRLIVVATACRTTNAAGIKFNRLSATRSSRFRGRSIQKANVHVLVVCAMLAWAPPLEPQDVTPARQNMHAPGLIAGTLTGNGRSNCWNVGRRKRSPQQT